MPDGAWNLERQLYAFIKEFTKAGRGFDFFWPVCLRLSSRERKEVKLSMFVSQPGHALWPAKEHFVDVLIFNSEPGIITDPSSSL